MGNLCKFSSPEIGDTIFERRDNSKSDFDNENNNNDNNFRFQSPIPISSDNNLNNRYNNDYTNNKNNEIDKNEYTNINNNEIDKNENNKINNNEIKEESLQEKIEEEKKEELEKEKSENQKSEGEIKSSKIKYINYNKEVFELINKIREDPSSYADKILDSIQYINEVKEIVKDKTTGEEKEIIKRTFKKKLKVALTRGEIAFKEAADELRQLKPIKPFIFNKDILIPLPDTIEQMKDPNFLKSQAEEKKKNSILDIYYKDLVKDPQISVLLMIVDDNGKKNGKKRYCLLNEEYKYIAINSKFIDKTFIAYFSFAK